MAYVLDNKSPAKDRASLQQDVAEQRRTTTTRQINDTLAELVDVDRHDAVRQRLLEINAQGHSGTAMGYN